MNERDLRSRAASALLAASRAADDELRLLYEDGRVATFASHRSKRRVVLVPAGESTSPDDLAAHLAKAVGANNRMFGPETHLVLVGGSSEEVAARVDAAMPRMLLAQLGFHHLDASGAVRKIAGVDLPWPVDLDAAASEGAQPFGHGHGPAEPRPGLDQARMAVPIRGHLAPRYTVTFIVAAVCGLLMLLAYAWGGEQLGPVLTRMGANTPATIENAELYRLFASAFLHSEMPHLVMNVFALLAFGPMLEGLLGSKRYTILYALSALGGSLASVLFRFEAFRSVGASGAIWGLMAAGFGVTYWPRGLLPELVAKAMRRRILIILGINLAFSLVPGIDMQAHLGGGVVGFVAVGLLGRGLAPVAARTSYDDIELRGRWASRFGAALSVLLMGASVIMALATGRPWELSKPPVFVRTPIGDSGLSLELPTVVAAKSVGPESPAPEVRIWGFGDADESPVLLEILVTQLEAAVAPEETEAFLEERLQQAKKAQPENHELQGAPTRVDLEGRPAVYVEYRLQKKVPVRAYEMLVNDREVIVRCYFLDDKRSAWRGIDRRIAGSIRADAAP